MLKNLRAAAGHKGQAGGGISPAGAAPRAVFAGMIGGETGNAGIWTLEHSGISMTVRTSAVGTGTTPTGVSWDGTYFYITHRVRSNNNILIERSTDGIAWTQVGTITGVSNTWGMNVVTLDSTTMICPIYDATSTADFWYVKSIDGGATWGTRQSIAITNGDIPYRILASDPTAGVFRIINAESLAGVHLILDDTVAVDTRVPAATTTADYTNDGILFNAVDKMVGMRSAIPRSIDKDFSGSTVDILTTTTSGNNQGTAITNYANGTCYDSRFWYLTRGAAASFNVCYTDDGLTSTEDYYWGQGDGGANGYAFQSNITAQGDAIICYGLNNASGTNPQFLVSWNNGGTWNAYDMPGTLTAKGDGIIHGVI